MVYKKIVIKVFAAKNGKGNPSWEHFCYVPKSLYAQFLHSTGKESFEFADFITVWAKKDFDFTKDLSNYENVTELRYVVAHNIRIAEYNISGVIKYWICTHMKEEIDKCQKELLPTNT